jgi:hypothetical protein
LAATNAYISKIKGLECKEKAAKKFDKYMKRMVAITNGSYKRIPNTAVSEQLVILFRKIY